MGTNNRYAHVIDAKMDARIIQSIMRTAEPDSLSDEEKGLDRDPLTRPPQPSAKTWVRYHSQAVQIDVELVAWTDRVAAFKWLGSEENEHRAWVLASAVRMR